MAGCITILDAHCHCSYEIWSQNTYNQHIIKMENYVQQSEGTSLIKHGTFTGLASSAKRIILFTKYRLWYCSVPHSILISSVFNLSQDQGLNCFNLILDSVSWFRIYWNWIGLVHFHFILTQRSSMFFCIFFNYKGYHRKMLQFIMPPKSIYNKIPWFYRTKKILLNTTERFKQ
jgi:hypothetical protein